MNKKLAPLGLKNDVMYKIAWTNEKADLKWLWRHMVEKNLKEEKNIAGQFLTFKVLSLTKQKTRTTMNYEWIEKQSRIKTI